MGGCGGWRRLRTRGEGVTDEQQLSLLPCFLVISIYACACSWSDEESDSEGEKDWASSEDDEGVADYPPPGQQG